MARKTEQEIEITVPEVVVTPEVTPAITVSMTSAKAKEASKVEIVTNETFKIAFGDRWYYFTKGVPVKVAPELKAFLLKQGALAVL